MLLAVLNEFIEVVVLEYILVSDSLLNLELVLGECDRSVDLLGFGIGHTGDCGDNLNN